ncbi:hypothetical protein EZMO1_1960 [Endozoicomonas montiporae CL-33]|nr:hypothetical protein EZMO1_1960 [Endozoicomonas montiporae CL-33]
MTHSDDTPLLTCLDSTTDIHLLNKKNTSDADYKRQQALSEKVGLALSGGGSRALVLLEALSQFMQPEYKTEISRFSASSGGAWAITATLMHSPKKVEAFLGSPNIELNKLYWDDTEKTPAENNIAQLKGDRLASVAQHLGYYSAALSFFLWRHFPFIFPGYKGWEEYLSYALLERFDLKPDAKLAPAAFPGLTNKGELIINAYLKGQHEEKIPIEMTPEWVGGAITSFKEGAYTLPPCGFNRDIKEQKLSCSNDYCEVKLGEGKGLTVANAMATTGANYVDTIPFSYFPPEFQYPEPNLQEKTIKSSSRMFADSGNEDYVSIMPLLRRGQKKIIAFVHTDIPLKHTPKKTGGTGIIGMDKVIPSYFGIIPDESAEKKFYQPDTHIHQQDCSVLSSRNKVFGDAHYQPLAEALWKAKENGKPIVYKQTGLTTLKNDCYGIPGGEKVDIIWIYNDLPENWFQTHLPALVGKIKADKDFDLFPHYGFKELYLKPPVANLMVALAKWTIDETQYIWRPFFED